MLQAYKGYYEDGRVITQGNPFIPEGSELIITVVDTPVINKAKRQKKAFEKFMASMDSTPPLPDEFDEIVNQRVNITREVEL